MRLLKKRSEWELVTTDQGVRLVMYWPNHSHVPMSVQPTDLRAFGDNTASENPPQSRFTDMSSFTHASDVPSMRVPPQNQPPPPSSFADAGEDAHTRAAFEYPPQPSLVNTISHAHNQPPGSSSFVHAGDETRAHAAFECSPQPYFADMSDSYAPTDPSVRSDVHPQAPAAFENPPLQRSESWPSVTGRRRDREMARLRRFISKKQQGEMDYSLDISSADNSSAVGAGYYSENVLASEEPCSVYCDNGFPESMDLSQTERESYGEKDSTSSMSSVSSVPSVFLDENEVYGRCADIALLAHGKGHESYDFTGEKPYKCSVDKSCVQLSLLAHGKGHESSDLTGEKSYECSVNKSGVSGSHDGLPVEMVAFPVDGSTAVGVEDHVDSVDNTHAMFPVDESVNNHSPASSDSEPGNLHSISTSSLLCSIFDDSSMCREVDNYRVFNDTSYYRDSAHIDTSQFTHILSGEKPHVVPSRSHTREKPHMLAHTHAREKPHMLTHVHTREKPSYVHTREKPSALSSLSDEEETQNGADDRDFSLLTDRSLDPDLDSPSGSDTTDLDVLPSNAQESTASDEPRFLSMRETQMSFHSWKTHVASYLSEMVGFGPLLGDCLWYDANRRVRSDVDSLALAALIGQVEHFSRLYGVISNAKPTNASEMWDFIYSLHSAD